MLPDPVLLQFLAIAWGGIVSAVAVRSDVRWRRIPNRSVVPACVAVPLLLALSARANAPGDPPGFPEALAMALGAGAGLAGVHLALALLGGLGGGDVKLALLLGTLLGHSGGAMAAAWGGALAWLGAGLAALTSRCVRRARARAPCSAVPAAPPASTVSEGLPFAPFLVAGSWAVIVVTLTAEHAR